MILNLPCRYYRVYTDPGVPCVEENLHHVERSLPVPVAEAALLLVDIWNTHYIESWLQRAAQVTRDRIVPLLAAAPQVGMMVIHGPSPPVARRYSGPPPPPGRAPNPAPDWPPPAFRGIYRTGE